MYQGLAAATLTENEPRAFADVSATISIPETDAAIGSNVVLRVRRTRMFESARCTAPSVT